jgi:sulfite exporter TauE/SafE
MIELPFVLAGGLLGSAHCVGMCGPLALTLGMNERRVVDNLRRQLAFSGGRIFTYAFLGAVAGFGGAWLNRQPQTLVNVQAVLAVAAGVALVAMGLHSAGVLPRILRGAWGKLAFAPALCSAGLIRAFLTAPGLANAALAGVFTGFLPCGLVYSFLAFAAATGHLASGAWAMVLFGLGTVPLMVATGCGASLVSLTTRTRLFQVAAWCVVATGVISITRGVGFLQLAGQTAPTGCPLCP